MNKQLALCLAVLGTAQLAVSQAKELISTEISFNYLSSPDDTRIIMAEDKQEAISYFNLSSPELKDEPQPDLKSTDNKVVTL